MTYCTRCGAPAIGYGRFCASCGAEIVVPHSARRLTESEQSTAGEESYSPPVDATTLMRSSNWRSQIWESGQLRRLILGGAASYVVTVALSAVLAAALVFVAASLLNVLLGGAIASSTTQTKAGASDIGTSLHLFAALTSYIFFASHLGPLEASGFGGATFSVLGIGSLSISLAAFLVPFLLARRAERRLQWSTGGWAFLRGTVLGIPYAVGAVALYLASSIWVGGQQFGLSIQPSLVGVFLAVIIVGVGGGLGAASIRVVKSAVAASVVRAAARACAAIALGAIAAAAIALVWIAVSALTQSSGSTASGGGASASSAVQQLGWALAGLTPFYVLNSVVLIWLATLDGSLFSSSPLHVLLYIGPFLGVVLSALRLRRPADRVEQGAYAAAFAAGTGLLAVAATPAIVNGASLLPNRWLGVLVALISAALSALAAPYLLAIEPIRAFVSGPPTWVMRPVLGLWPADATEGRRVPPEPSAKLVRPGMHFRIHVGRIYAALAILLLVLVSGGLVANSQLRSRFGPEAAAVAYLTAKSRGDADGMWALMTIETAGSAEPSPFLTKGGLKAMLTIAQNKDLRAFKVVTSSRQDDANYSLTIDMTITGKSTRTDLQLRRDPTRANWVIYPYWRVVVVPSMVKIATYQHAGQLSLDGLVAGRSSEAGSIAVIPGIHRVDLAPTDLFAGDTRLIDASEDTTVAFSAQLSTDASGALKRVVAGVLAQCAVAQSLNPAGCPNSASPIAGYRESRIHWTLIGDPLVGVSVSAGEAIDSVVASGGWQMHVSFDYWSNSGSARVKRWDQDVTGTFSVKLQWSGADFAVTDQTGTTLSATGGTSSMPAPSITAEFESPANGGYSWRVTGQYFTPRQTIEVFLIQPPYPGSADAPGLSASPDGTFSGSFGLAAYPGKATIKACDSDALCATVPVSVP